jgi:hypothetical protein
MHAIIMHVYDSLQRSSQPSPSDYSVDSADNHEYVYNVDLGGELSSRVTGLVFQRFVLECFGWEKACGIPSGSRRSNGLP